MFFYRRGYKSTLWIRGGNVLSFVDNSYDYCILNELFECIKATEYNPFYLVITESLHNMHNLSTILLNVVSK